MALVQVTSVEVGNNPAPLLAQMEFTISFECAEDLSDGETDRSAFSRPRREPLRLWAARRMRSRRLE